MEPQRETIIRNYFDPQSSFNFEDLYDWLAPDVVVVEAEGLPWSGIYYGRKGVGDYMSQITLYIISQVELEEVFSCNNQVVAIGKSVGMVVRTKQPFSIGLVILFTFDETDKIKKVQFLRNLRALQEVLHEKLTAT